MKTFDIECLQNYTLYAFMDEAGSIERVEVKGEDSVLSKKQRKKLVGLLKDDTIITYNGNRYDMIITAGALGGLSCRELFKVSQRIIVEGVAPWKMYQGRIKELYWVDHIDLIEPAPDPNRMSLKLYGARLLSQKLWEYDVDWNAPLKKEDMEGLNRYCGNDLILTWDLYRMIEPSIELRKRMSKDYGVDLRSKSDAQIAEAVILKKIGGNVSKPRIPDAVRYTAPDWLQFKDPQLRQLKRDIENETFKLQQSTGKPESPEWLKNTIIRLGEAQFQVGLGAIHSTEECLTIKSDDEYVMRNADVASFYPRIIINSKLFPPQLGEKFLRVFENIVETRLKAKAEGDKGTAESLKITINGSFGKFGSEYSKLFAPDLMLAVTFTGQLSLLMLIEWLEYADIPVISANTDGVEYYCPRKRVKEALKIIRKWEKVTGYTMDNDEYISLHARDINNYIAKYDGYVKSKGAYKALNDQPILKKNPQVPICYTAVREYINSGKKIEKTIRQCKDVAQFCSARKVNGGAMYEGEKIGSVVRWYYANSGKAMHYIKANKTGNHNMVPMTLGCKPMMDLTEKIPKDLDYQWYIDYAHRVLEELG